MLVAVDQVGGVGWGSTWWPRWGGGCRVSGAQAEPVRMQAWVAGCCQMPGLRTGCDVQGEAQQLSDWN